jgi:hypothetical protein
MNVHARIADGWEDRDLALGRPLAPVASSPGTVADGGAGEPETAVLAAITSGYEDARARIISAPPAAPAGRHRAERVPEVAAPGWAPTVPVDLGAVLPRPPRDRPDRPDRQAPSAPARTPRSRRDLLRALVLRLGTDLGRPTPWLYS